MSRRTFTANELEKLKREAKKLAKSEGIPHVKALDRIADREGYQSWWHLQHSSESLPPITWIDVPNFGKMPLVVAQGLAGGLGYRVQCPFCNKPHTHEIAEGSRLSHCTAGGHHQYYLRLADVSGPALPWGESVDWIDVPNFGKMPLVIVQASQGPGYKVQCPFCGLTHTHGVSEGSRLSHCPDGGHEYYLRLVDISGPALPWGESGTTAATDASSSNRSKHALVDLITMNGPCRSQSQPGPASLLACILWNGHDGMHRRFGKTWTNSQGHMPSSDEIAGLEAAENGDFGADDNFGDEDDE